MMEFIKIKESKTLSSTHGPNIRNCNFLHSKDEKKKTETTNMLLHVDTTNPVHRT